MSELFGPKGERTLGMKQPKLGQYPTVHVNHRPDGSMIIESTDENDPSYQYYHGPSGTHFVINKEGEVSVTTSGELRVSSAAMTITVAQNADIKVDGHAKVSATSMDAQVAGALSLTAAKTTTLNFLESLAIRAKNMVFSCDGNFSVYAEGTVNHSSGGTNTIEAPKFVADADCYIGGETGAKPASREGTIDTCGCADTNAFATRVKLA